MRDLELAERIRKWREGVDLLHRGQLAQSERARLAFTLWHEGMVISRALTMLRAGYFETLSDDGLRYEWKKCESANDVLD